MRVMRSKVSGGQPQNQANPSMSSRQFSGRRAMEAAPVERA